MILVKGADSYGFIEAVHDGHAQIGDDQAVDVLTACEGVLDFGEGLKAVVGTVYESADAFETEAPEGKLHANDVEWFIVNDEDTLDGWDWEVLDAYLGIIWILIVNTHQIV